MDDGTILLVQESKVPTHLDLLIVAIGYEERSRFVAETLAAVSSRRVAFSFRSDGVGSFDRNLAVSQDAGFEVLPLDDNFEMQFKQLLAFAPKEGYHIGIDVSSFTKFYLAEIVDSLASHKGHPIDVDFLYAPASSEGWEVPDSPIRIAEPVHPSFASWIDDPSQPLTAIIGLGVEDNLALGVTEHLDVSAVYAFTPTSADKGFQTMGDRANQEFFLADYVVRRAEYDILNPFGLFARLESLVYGLNSQSRIAIVPLGPKIFALCAFLASALAERSTTVWRFSAGDSDSPVDVKASGEIVALGVLIRVKDAEEEENSPHRVAAG